MAINWNMDVGSLSTLFKKKKSSVRASDALIPATKKVWRFSVMFLGIFAILIVSYDAYIFWEYVYNQQDVDIGEQGNVKGIDRPLFDGVVRMLDERTVKFERAKSIEPIRNPFAR